MSRLEDMRLAALEYSLSRAAIFSGLPAEDLHRLAGYASLRRLARRAILFRKGDPVVGFYIVRSGLVSVYRVDAEGKEQIIHLLRPGDSFAERAITSSAGYPATARALEDSEVILIPKDEFRDHQKKRPDLAWRMVVSMSHHLRAMVATMEGLRFRDVETRFLNWLLQRCPQAQGSKPVEIALGISKGELAEELLIRPETLSRIFRKLKEEGHLQVHPRSLLVLQPAKLRQLFAGKVKNS